MFLLTWLGAKLGAGAGLSTGRNKTKHAGDQSEPVGHPALHFVNACLLCLEWSRHFCGVVFVFHIRKL